MAKENIKEIQWHIGGTDLVLQGIDDTNVIKTSAQTLTEEQKSTSRENIGAGTLNESDLADYALKTEIPDISGVASEEFVTNTIDIHNNSTLAHSVVFDNYTPTNELVSELTPTFALKNEIPSSVITDEELVEAITEHNVSVTAHTDKFNAINVSLTTKANLADLNNYVETSTLNNYTTTNDLVSELTPTFALKTEIPDTSNLAAESFVEDEITAHNNDNRAHNAVKYISQSLSNEEKTQARNNIEAINSVSFSAQNKDYGAKTVTGSYFSLNMSPFTNGPKIEIMEDQNTIYLYNQRSNVLIYPFNKTDIEKTYNIELGFERHYDMLNEEYKSFGYPSISDNNYFRIKLENDPSTHRITITKFEIPSDNPVFDPPAFPAGELCSIGDKFIVEIDLTSNTLINPFNIVFVGNIKWVSPGSPIFPPPANECINLYEFIILDNSTDNFLLLGRQKLYSVL